MGEPYTKTYRRGYRSRITYSQVRENVLVHDEVSGIQEAGTQQWTDSLVGEKNAKWRSQVRLGLDATTNLTASSTEIIVEPFYVAVSSRQTDVPNTWWNAKSFGYPSLNYTSIAPPSATVISATNNRALRKLFDAVDSIRSSFEGGQNIGEWKQVVGAVTNPLGSLRRYTLSHFDSLKKVKRRYGRDKLSLRKALADSYLEYTFGWKPIASDLAKAIVGFQNLDEHLDLVPFDVGASELYTGSDSTFNMPQNPNVWCVLACRSKDSGTYQVRYKGTVRTGAVNGSISVVQASRLLPSDWLPTAWELIPYSFVADYFANIGEIIRGYSLRRSVFGYFVKTTRTLGQRVYTPVEARRAIGSNSPNIKITSKTFSGGNARITFKSITRTKLSSTTLIPTFQVSLPLGSYKPWLNMGALLASRSEPLVPFF